MGMSRRVRRRWRHSLRAGGGNEIASEPDGYFSPIAGLSKGVRIPTSLKFLLVVPGPVGLAIIAVALLVIAVEVARLLLG
jgi:hypothetical protein